MNENQQTSLQQSEENSVDYYVIIANRVVFHCGKINHSQVTQISISFLDERIHLH